MKVNHNDVIDYDVRDIIFHEGSLRVSTIRNAIEKLLHLQELDAFTSYEVENLVISYHFEAESLNLSIENVIDDSFGLYRISKNEHDLLFFDCLEASNDYPFVGDVITYIAYDQNNTYHERVYLENNAMIHYFQYDYTFETEVATTFLVTTAPDSHQYDVARSERYFKDNYYLVYSKGHGYEHQYFTLFHNHHASINVNHVLRDSNPNHHLGYTVQWNLIDIPAWDHIENNRVYFDDKSLSITPFTYQEFPYFGPEFTITEAIDSSLTNDVLENPLDSFAYSIYTLEDCEIPMRRLDELQLEIDVSENSYTELGELKYFSDGFYDRFLEFMSETYLNNVRDFISDAE